MVVAKHYDGSEPLRQVSETPCFPEESVHKKRIATVIVKYYAAVFTGNSAGNSVQL